MSWRGRAAQWCRTYRLDIAWVVFVGINLAAMRLLPDWGTVPFLAIWVSLTAIYGVRLWRLQPTILTWTAVTLATGGIIVVQVLKGQQDADYLAEVPLIALMFLVMVWHGQRRITAMQQQLAAMQEVQRVSQENLRLLQEQHRFLQDASHELGTPITVALGHAELMERAANDTVLADDARVVAGELLRLGRMASRILLLASPGSAHRRLGPGRRARTLGLPAPAVAARAGGRGDGHGRPGPSRPGARRAAGERHRAHRQRRRDRGQRPPGGRARGADGGGLRDRRRPRRPGPDLPALRPGQPSAQP